MIDGPPLWDDLAALATAARTIHADRASGYPAQVARGRLSREDAEAGIRIMAAIAADWGELRTGAEPESDAPQATEHEKRTCLAVIADRLKNDRSRLADCARALLWWQQPWRDGVTTSRRALITSITREGRKLHRSATAEAA